MSVQSALAAQQKVDPNLNKIVTQKQQQFNSYAAANPGGGIGGAVGRNLGFDPTPGFNITNPFISNSAVSGGAKPANTDDGDGKNLVTDPYAQYGGQTAYNNLVNNYNQQYGAIQSSVNDAATQKANEYNVGILDYLDQIRSAQSGINNKIVQNELAKKQGTQAVTAGVGRGIRSGGVMLANKNAGNSSAAEGLSRAYGEIGRQQLSGIGNQYAQNQGQIAQSQADLATQQASGQRHLALTHDSIVNGIVDAAQQQLAALDATAANASLPQRINIEQEKASIKSRVLGQLQQYDQTLQTGMGSIQQVNPDAAREQANALAMAGRAPAEAFQYTSETPAQLQGTGPFASELPIFTFPGSLKKQVA